MGASESRRITVPPKGTLAYYMYANYSPFTCKFLKKWNWYTRDDPKLQSPLEGSFDLDKIVHLRGALQAKAVGQGQFDAYFDWYWKTEKQSRKSQLRSLKDSQKKLKTPLKKT